LALKISCNKVAGGHGKLGHNLLHNIIAVRAHYGLQDVTVQLLGDFVSITLTSHFENLLD